MIQSHDNVYWAKMRWRILVFLILFDNITCGHKTPKFLFNIVRFRNDPCQASNEDKEQGICYTSEECASRGGQPRNSCAAGFGTCCLFRGSTNSPTSFDAPISYFTNPSYPDEDWMPNYNTFTIKVTNPQVCQIRLDFVDFKMSGPSLSASPYGHCLNDRMAIFSTQRENLGLSDGNLICGDMTGQHVNASLGEDQVRLFAMVGGNNVLPIPIDPVVPRMMSNYTWNIKVTQIDCSFDNPQRAPEGCLQYFIDPSGTIESFNFRADLSLYPASSDYAICIRRQQGFCGINLAIATPSDEFKMNTNGNDVAPGYGKYCYDFSASLNTNVSSDYMAILGAYTFLGTMPAEASHFCGIFDGINAVFPGIFTSYPGPLVINVRTDESLKGRELSGPPRNPQAAIGMVTAGSENGFRLTYSHNRNCYRTR